MLFEMKRLLDFGQRVVVEGLSGSGKSYTISKFMSGVNTLRNADFYSTESVSSKKFYDAYRLFDRNAWIDRYVYIYETDDALDLCAERFAENFSDCYLLLLMDDRWGELRDGYALHKDERDNYATRMLRIAERIWLSGGVEGVIVTTPVSFRSTEFWKGNDFWELCRTEVLERRQDMKREEYRIPEHFDRVVEAANDFYNGRTPELTDYDYDELLKELKEENPSFNIFDYVTYEGQGEKRPHMIHIPNFEKVEFERVQTEGAESGVVLTPKNDGCSCLAYYTNGRLQTILTRSNEETGVVQTEKLRHKVPQKVDPQVRAILFECTVEGDRSKANGLINSKYKQDEVDEKLFVNFFDVVLNGRLLGYEARMKLAGVEPTILTIKDAVRLKQMGDEPYIEAVREGKLRKIPVDGIVAYSNIDPRYGRIYKFYASTDRVTTVTGLTYKFSNDTGLVSVVVNFEPVKIGFITAKNCGNAGSWKTICEKQLGVGSEVKVHLAKATIPAISENTPWTEEPEPTCPWCGEPLVEFQGKLLCENMDCGGWEDMFETKYFNILCEHKGSEWVDEFTVNGKFGIDMMARAEVETGLTLTKFLTVPEYMFYLLKPKGVNGKTYEEVKQRVLFACKKNPPKDTIELAQLLLGNIFNQNQHEYCELVWKRLMYFLKKEVKVRKALMAK